jgi:HEAT repeat protein
MQSETRRQSGREKDEAAVKLLEKLQDQLHSSDASVRRRAAFNLSWMQEDGLEILKSALYGNFPTTTKNAAAYGLRKMRGRMKKIALNVLNKGLKHRDKSTREICKNAFQLLGQKVHEESETHKRASRKSRIKEIPRKTRPRRIIDTRRTR